MPINIYGLSNSALSDIDPNSFKKIYPEGTLLVHDASGTSYRAGKVSKDAQGEANQLFSVTDANGMSGHSPSIPEDAKVIWFPNTPA